MLGMKNYSREYIDACRAKVQSDVSAYGAAFSGEKAAAAGALETAFFNNMVLVLDDMFVHRLAGVDGKDGNPLNEVRVMADSILSNGGVMTSGTVSKSSQMRFNKAIKLIREKSVLNYAAGDEIKLSQADFAELESRYLL
jgi:hypothetical protein